MVFSLISNAATSIVVYLYPSYATFKVIARRPGTENDVEKWLVYWSVVAVFAAFETSLQWLVNWVIFYSEIKTLFLVFLSQGGASILYKSYLAPFYTQYEPQIDAHIASVRTSLTAYIQERLQGIYKLVLGAVGAAQNEPTPQQPQQPQGALDVANDLWNTYGAGLLAAGAKAVHAQGQKSDGADVQNRSGRTTPLPSPSVSAHSTGVDTSGPQFPVPNVPSSSSGYEL